MRNKKILVEEQDEVTHTYHKFHTANIKVNLANYMHI